MLSFINRGNFLIYIQEFKYYASEYRCCKRQLQWHSGHHIFISLIVFAYNEQFFHIESSLLDFSDSLLDLSMGVESHYNYTFFHDDTPPYFLFPLRRKIAFLISSNKIIGTGIIIRKIHSLIPIGAVWKISCKNGT